MKRSVFFFVSALFLGFASTPALAYIPYIATESAVPVERGNSRLDLAFGFEKWDTNPRETRYIMDTELSYGLINNLEFTVNVPYVVKNVSRGRNRSGLGDLTLKAKIRFIKGRAANPVSISGMIISKFPSCNENKGLTPDCTGEPDMGFKAITSKEFFPVTVHLNLGYLFIGNPPNTDFDDVFSYSIGADLLTQVDFLHVVGEFAGETNRDPDSGSDPLSMLIGVLYELDLQKVVTVAADFGLTKAAPEVGLNFGFRYLF